jgi:hypothetical protein
VEQDPLAQELILAGSKEGFIPENVRDYAKKDGGILFSQTPVDS